MNITHTYLLAARQIESMGFSGALTNASVYLSGPSGQAGDGLPVPYRGYLTRIQVWDGATLHSDTDEIAFNADDRISVYCQSSGSDFTIKVRVNGSSTNLQVAGVPFNTTLYVTVEFLLFRE